MKVTSWKKYEKASLRGFFELHLDSGLSIRGMTYHAKNDKRWTAFPAKPYEDENGETKYQNILYIPDDNRWKIFQKQALAALDAYFAANQQEEPEDVPF
jgi:hypothetical protein